MARGFCVLYNLYNPERGREGRKMSMYSDILDFPSQSLQSTFPGLAFSSVQFFFSSYCQALQIQHAPHFSRIFSFQGKALFSPLWPKCHLFGPQLSPRCMPSSPHPHPCSFLPVAEASRRSVPPTWFFCSHLSWKLLECALDFLSVRLLLFPRSLTITSSQLGAGH